MYIVKKLSKAERGLLSRLSLLLKKDYNYTNESLYLCLQIIYKSNSFLIKYGGLFLELLFTIWGKGGVQYNVGENKKKN